MTLERGQSNRPSAAGAPVRVQMLRVFTDARGEHGNRLGVLDYNPDVRAEQLVRLTGRLQLSETVLLGPEPASPVRVFTPVRELSFAGHPLVGVAWLLDQRGRCPKEVQCGAGACEVSVQDELTWMAAPISWADPWDSVQYQSPPEVEELTGAPEGHDFVQTWAWIDPSAGRVRARVFAPRDGIAEDEACGSASLLLAHRLGRELVIEHGRGSVVYACPLAPGIARVGGRVTIDQPPLELLLDL